MVSITREGVILAITSLLGNTVVVDSLLGRTVVLCSLLMVEVVLLLVDIGSVVLLGVNDMKVVVFPVVLRVAVEVVSLCLIVVTETVGWQWIMNVTCYILLYLQFDNGTYLEQ